MARPKLYNVPLYIDDRGYVYCPFDNLDSQRIKRTYVVENHGRGMVRAWHGHRKASTYIHVIHGAAKLAACHMDNPNDFTVVSLASRNPGVFCIPPNYYNGTMSLEAGTKMLVYSTISFNQCKNDDYRANWEDLHPEIWEVKWR